MLGILTMNAVAYGLPHGYFNLDSQGTETWLDWLMGGLGEIFFDQKFMGLFSMLFGAGIVLFADRASARFARPGWFSLWRNTLLLGIGIVHMWAWDGDVLMLYAVCAPLLIWLRMRHPVLLAVFGSLLVLSSAGLAIVVQTTVGNPSKHVGGGYWLTDGTLSDAVGIWMLYDFFARALGMMLIGVAMYRLGVIGGEKSRDFYARTAKFGLGFGLPLSGMGLLWMVLADFSPDVAVVGSLPNTIATIPVVLGYMSVLILWDARAESRLQTRVRCAGRMALTNYLSQTALGIIVFTVIFDNGSLSRSWLAVFVLAVWALQLWWSEAWLSRFRYGPTEWLWRSATYWRWQKLRLPCQQPHSA